MTYHTLPLVTGVINSSNLKLKFNDSNVQWINKTLAKYLNQVKCQIDKHSEDWDNIKKIYKPI